MADLAVNTVVVDEVTRMAPRGDIEAVHRVRFRVGDHGPFSLFFTQAEFTTENVQAAMEAKAAVVRSLPL